MPSVRDQRLVESSNSRRPNHLLELLEASCAGRGVIQFLPDHSTPRSLADLWRDSGLAARWLSARIPEGGTVAAVLATSPGCLAALVGAWRAGLTVASLPTPARGMQGNEYQSQINGICGGMGVEMLLVDDAYKALVPPIIAPVVSFGECADSGRGGRLDCLGEFVQFTSGSTRSPRGVRLDLFAVAANILSIIEALEPMPGEQVCSWLPLSHDMGLIGLCLTPWVGAAPDIAGEGTLCLIRPEAFLHRPSVWLQTCSELGATITAAPSFALQLAARALAPSNQLDLHRLRVCIVGADMVRADTLRSFARAAGRFGFSELSFCPAYGLAEATLAVTMVRPAEHWSTRTVDPVTLAEGAWVERDSGAGRELVSTGTPVGDMRVRVRASASSPGVIEVAGPSLLAGYVGDDLDLDDGWLGTNDLGCLIAGELFVTGRTDDLLVVAGQNHYAADVEDIVSSHAGIRARNAVALADDDRYLVVAEAARGVQLPDVAHGLRAALIEQLGVGPSSVRFVAPGSLPKTPSGKLQRHRVQALLTAGALAGVTEFDFRSRT